MIGNAVVTNSFNSQGLLWLCLNTQGDAGGTCQFKLSDLGLSIKGYLLDYLSSAGRQPHAPTTLSITVVNDYNQDYLDGRGASVGASFQRIVLNTVDRARLIHDDPVITLTGNTNKATCTVCIILRKLQ